MIKRIIGIGLLVVMLTGCSFDEPITFLRLQEVKVNGIKDGSLLLSTKAVFNNPNTESGKIKKINIYVLYRKDTLARVNQSQKVKVPAQDRFNIPLSVELSIDRLQKGLLSNLTSLLSKRTVELEFKGNIKVSSFGVQQKVPVDYKEKIKF